MNHEYVQILDVKKQLMQFQKNQIEDKQMSKYLNAMKEFIQYADVEPYAPTDVKTNLTATKTIHKVKTTSSILTKFQHSKENRHFKRRY